MLKLRQIFQLSAFGFLALIIFLIIKVSYHVVKSKGFNSKISYLMAEKILLKTRADEVFELEDEDFICLVLGWDMDGKPYGAFSDYSNLSKVGLNKSHISPPGIFHFNSSELDDATLVKLSGITRKSKILTHIKYGGEVGLVKSPKFGCFLPGDSVRISRVDLRRTNTEGKKFRYIIELNKVESENG